jgi:STAM-binding protein
MRPSNGIPPAATPGTAAAAGPPVPAGAKPASTPRKPRIPSMDDLRLVLVPQALPAEFLRLAAVNTAAGIETCGILCGILKGNAFVITHCILPKQNCTENTCATTDEQQLIDIQLKHSVLTLGWIHTHPTQTCFLSSVDLHTHFSYQIMMAEAIAIVMAPTANPASGVFSITPAGMAALSSCKRSGFHKHEENFPLYGPAAHGRWISDKVSFIDVRS